MSNEVLDTDFLPLDLLTTEEGIQNEISKCDSLRMALMRHQLALVKKLAKITNKIVIRIEQYSNNVIINDYCVIDRNKIDDVSCADSLHYEIEDFGDCEVTEREVIEND